MLQLRQHLRGVIAGLQPAIELDVVDPGTPLPQGSSQQFAPALPPEQRDTLAPHVLHSGEGQQILAGDAGVGVVHGPGKLSQHGTGTRTDGVGGESGWQLRPVAIDPLHADGGRVGTDEDGCAVIVECEDAGLDALRSWSILYRLDLNQWQLTDLSAELLYQAANPRGLACGAGQQDAQAFQCAVQFGAHSAARPAASFPS